MTDPKKKTIRHLGMKLTEEEHERWHREHGKKPLSPEEHAMLMQHLGVTPEEDRKWHQQNEGACLDPSPARTRRKKA